MPNDFKPTDHLKDYYKEWISVYKEGAIRDVTLSKYKMSHLWIEKLVPELRYYSALYPPLFSPISRKLKEGTP